MKVHSIKTENHSVHHKVELRKQAVGHLKTIKVLDLFAGNNTLWSYVKTDRYYGVEKEKNKGKNLTADNMRVIGSLDLSGFNVIDCDSYGIPFNQISEIFKNETLQKGTVIIYTCITNKMSGLNKECLKMYNLGKIYKKAKTLINARAIEMFYGMLYKNGIRKVKEFEINTHFIKKYGYFEVI